MRKSRNKVSGFTLVEVMVAVTIGLIILAAVAQIFATSRATYALEENLARVQENGRFAMEFLTRDLRMAGYAGCVNVNQALNANANYTITHGLNNPGNFENAFAPQIHMQGHEWTSTNTWSPALPAFLAGQVRDESDVIVIRRGSEQSFPLDATIAQNAGIPIRDTGNTIQAEDVILVGDCSNLDIVKVTAITSGGGVNTLAHDTTAGSGSNAPDPQNASVNLSQGYGTNAEVMKLITRAYFIGTTGGGVPALMSWDMDKGEAAAAARLELIEGIESMHILYGEDTDGNGSADLYALPAAVTDWSRVVSVRIGLLARTPAQSGQDVDTRTYDLLADAGNANDDFDPVNDKRQRRIFSSTIQVRNLRTD